MKIILANQFKNEALRIEEWLKYHQELGFKDFVLMDDNSNDDSIKIAKSINNINVDILTFKNNRTAFNGSIDTDRYRGSTEFAKNISDSFIKIHNYCYDKYGKDVVIGFFDVDEFIFSENNLDITSFIKEKINDLPVLSIFGFEVNSNNFNVNNGWVTLQTTLSMSYENKLKSTKKTNIKSFQNLNFKDKISFFEPCLKYGNYGGIIHNGGVNDENVPPNYLDLAFLHYRYPIYDPETNIPLCNTLYNSVITTSLKINKNEKI